MCLWVALGAYAQSSMPPDVRAVCEDVRAAVIVISRVSQLAPFPRRQKSADAASCSRMIGAFLCKAWLEYRACLHMAVVPESDQRDVVYFRFWDVGTTQLPTTLWRCHPACPQDTQPTRHSGPRPFPCFVPPQEVVGPSLRVICVLVIP